MVRMMETSVIDMTAGIDGTEMARAGRIIREGGLVAFPTETVYGLGANALDEEASAKIYAAKGRPSDNPLIVHICEFSALDKIASQIPEAAVKLADAFWPGPLTMIFPKTEMVPYGTTGGLDTVAVRILLRQEGGILQRPVPIHPGDPALRKPLM